MFSHPLRVLSLAACTLLSLLLANCGGSSRASGKPLAVATIFAYYDALRAIAGPDVDTAILLPPGSSPHEFSPTFEDKKTVSRCQLIIKNGLGLDDWVQKLASDNASVTTLSIGDELEAIQTHEESLTPPPSTTEKAPEKTATESGDTNPHVWLDPMNQIKAAEKIRDALVKIDPAHKADFDARAAAYIETLKQLDADFKAAAATFTHKEFVGFHSAYDYLARRYGLKQAASIEEIGAGGLNPAQIQRVIQIIKDRHIPVVFTETAFDSKQAQTVVNETGAKLGTLQPLETYDNITDTYVGLMRQNLEEMKKNMQ